MKFVTLRRRWARQYREIHKSPHVTRESLAEPGGVPHQAHSYAELRQQIHDDLRIQHPDWVQPNGESPKCDAYETRLMELLRPLTRNPDSHDTAENDATVGHGLN